MELDESYDLSLHGLEGYVRENYNEGIKKLRTSYNPIHELEIVQEMFSTLSESHAGEDYIGWAVDYIKAYRNLGRIVKGLDLDYLREVELDSDSLEGILEKTKNLKSL